MNAKILHVVYVVAKQNASSLIYLTAYKGNAPGSEGWTNTFSEASMFSTLEAAEIKLQNLSKSNLNFTDKYQIMTIGLVATHVDFYKIVPARLEKVAA